jgi:hypothetical protein
MPGIVVSEETLEELRLVAREASTMAQRFRDAVLDGRESAADRVAEKLVELDDAIDRNLGLDAAQSRLDHARATISRFSRSRRRRSSGGSPTLPASAHSSTTLDRNTAHGWWVRPSPPIVSAGRGGS